MVSLKNILLSIAFLVLHIHLFGQTYEMDNVDGSVVNTCSGVFYDSGGFGGNYGNGENYEVTFCSDNGGNITFNFISFDIEAESTCNYDDLTIYDGPSTASSLIGKYCNSTGSPGTITSSGTCLTFTFSSDGSVVDPGWEANISCSTNTCPNSYKDEFSSSNYNLSNGSINWTPISWIETNDDGSAASGAAQITGGELQMNRTGAQAPIVERALNLNNAVSATWTFDVREAGNLEASDIFYAEVFNGSTWTTVFQVANDFAASTQSIDITPYANANTRIRFRIDNFGGSGEFLYVDDVEICFIVGVVVNTDFFLEAECANHIGSGWFVDNDPTASNENYAEPKSGDNFLPSPPADTQYYMTYRINVDSADNYKIFGRVKAPNTNDDSFWVRANGGTWYKWNGLNATNWTWRQVWDSDNSNALVAFPLVEGFNNIDIAVREDGTQLDKLYITLDGTLPTGQGSAATNCYFLYGTDTDGDGIVNGIDLDDDNDGILDSRESPSEIDFSGTRTLLVGSSQSNLTVGDKVLYDDAIRDCNDIIYDAIITINSRSPGVTVAANSNGIDISGALASQDDHTTFTISVVEDASATVGNPTGTPATITDIIIDMQDVDSDDGDDYTEVVGFNNVGGPTTSYLANPTSLELGGFENGQGPAGSWTLYRQAPLVTTPSNDWSTNENISSSIESPEISMFMVFNDFSSVQLVFGLTGSLSSAPTISTRATRFGASAECDRDGDGVPNRLDLDLDNDGIYDMHEAGHGLADLDNDGRIDGADTLSGANGIFDGIETSPESGTLNYAYSQSDGDMIEDPFDLDSDADGCFDTFEGDNSDPDNDGTAGSGTPAVDINGLVISIIYKKPPTDAWQDPLRSCLEICDNGIDDDGDGDIDEDDEDCANYYLEAECAFPGSNWNRGMDVLASNNDYLTISPGLNSETIPPTGADDLIRFTVNIDNDGLYRFMGRVYSLNGADDSFWFRVDGGTWYRWNNWNTAGVWKWQEFTDYSNGNTIVKYTLTAGVHTIDIAYSEDGARLDKLHLTINGTTPDDLGNDAINCGRTVTYNLFLPYKILNK